jgi:predicted site-specific integrase-resolvase
MTIDPFKSPEGLQPPALFTERNLADRWQLSCRTLQRWRAEGFGPAWIWIGGSVRYRINDVVAYEARNRQGRGAEQ